MKDKIKEQFISIMYWSFNWYLVFFIILSLVLRFSLIFMDSHGFSLIFINSHWFSQILTDSLWFSSILSDSHWFTLILSDSLWISSILFDSIRISPIISNSLGFTQTLPLCRTSWFTLTLLTVLKSALARAVRTVTSLGICHLAKGMQY